MLADLAPKLIISSEVPRLQLVCLPVLVVDGAVMALITAYQTAAAAAHGLPMHSTLRHNMTHSVRGACDSCLGHAYPGVHLHSCWQSLHIAVKTRVSAEACHTFLSTCDMILFVLCMSSLLGTLRIWSLLCCVESEGKLKSLLGAGTVFISGSRSFCSLKKALWTLYMHRLCKCKQSVRRTFAKTQM